jgi:protein-tyrosine phosphatase
MFQFQPIGTFHLGYAIPTHVMINFIKHKVSQNRKRYIDEKYDLDLSYITPKIIAMGLPSSGINAYYRNDENEVAEFLKEKHNEKFMIWNLSMKDYDIEKFDNQVLSFGFPDHHNPPISTLFQIVKSIDSWINAGTDNVAVVHCVISFE